MADNLSIVSQSATKPLSVVSQKPIIAPQPKEGAISSFAHEIGLPTSLDELHSASDQFNPIKHPINALVPGYPMLKGMAQGAVGYGKRVLGDAYDAGQSLAAHNPSQAGVDAIDAIPILGPAELKASDQYGEGNKGGALGTITGAALQVAPAILGGVDAASGFDRPLLGRIPTRSHAGATLESLNNDLANHPVKLNSTLDPLQRVTEISARGSSAPKAVTDLLTRSQSPIDMTFPEARDYQSSLSDLSRSDKLAMNNRMRGGVAQLNKSLFDDMMESANQAGRGADYKSGMTEYRRAAQLNDLFRRTASNVGRVATKTIPPALGLGAVYELHKDLTK